MNPREALQALLGSLVGLSLVACIESPDRAVVELSAPGLNASEELDTLRLTLTAATDASGQELCVPVTEVLSLDTADATAVALPYTLAIEPGEQIGHRLYLRVEGLHLGTLRFRNDRMVSLSGGDVAVHVAITADCLADDYAVGEHCTGGVRTTSPHAVIFDQGMYVGTESCLAE
jgi:hypothetical protein